MLHMRVVGVFVRTLLCIPDAMCPSLSVAVVECVLSYSLVVPYRGVSCSLARVPRVAARLYTVPGLSCPVLLVVYVAWLVSSPLC